MSALSPQHPVALRTGHPGVLQPVIPTAPLHPNPNPTPKLMVQNGKGHLLAEKPPQSLLFAIWTGSLGTAASYQGRLTDFRGHGRKVGGLQTCTVHDIFAQSIGVRRGMSPPAAVAPSECSESTGVVLLGECSCTRLGQAA